MQIAILGAGMVGRAMAIDLQQKYSVTSFDVSEQSLDILSKKNKLIKTVKSDLSNFENYPTLLQKFVRYPALWVTTHYKQLLMQGKM